MRNILSHYFKYIDRTTKEVIMSEEIFSKISSPIINPIIQHTTT